MLASAGYGSRREIEALMAAGRVMVNDRPAVLGMKVGPSDHVTIDGKPCNAPPSRAGPTRRTVGTITERPRTVAEGTRTAARTKEGSEGAQP